MKIALHYILLLLLVKMCSDGLNIIVLRIGKGWGVSCVGVRINVFSSMSLFLLNDTSVLFLSFFQVITFLKFGGNSLDK